MTPWRHRLTNVQRRGWRAYADLRRITTRPRNHAARTLARQRDQSLDAWNDVTSERHERYRSAHPAPPGDVAIVCVSRRPHLLGEIVKNVARQHDVAPRLLLVPNDPAWDLDAAASALTVLPAAEIVTVGANASLGHALNTALAATSARFIAKFDDDDHYGSHHLVDLLRAHGYARSGVVGKHTYYARVAGEASLQLRFAGHEFSYSSTLAGGTLVIDRERTGDLLFDDVSLGEDRAFIAACHRRGISTFAADRFNFVQYRGDDNTWAVPPARFLEGCRAVDETASEHQVDR